MYLADECSGVAQPVEQLICNQQVGGSNPSTSSTQLPEQFNMEEFPSGQRGQTVNLLSVTSVVRIHPPPPRRRKLIGLRRFFISQARIRRPPRAPIPPQPLCADLLKFLPAHSQHFAKLQVLLRLIFKYFPFSCIFFTENFPILKEIRYLGVFRAISVQFAQKLLFEKYEFFPLRYLQIQRRACIMFLTKNIGFPLPI